MFKIGNLKSKGSGSSHSLNLISSYILSDAIDVDIFQELDILVMSAYWKSSVADPRSANNTTGGA